MNDKSARQLEAEILERVDELIDCLIASGLATGDQRDQELNIGIDKIKQIAELFAANFPQAFGFFDTALKEMVGQKLADPKLLASFLDLSENLDRVIQEGTRQLSLVELLPFEPEAPEKLGWFGAPLLLENTDILKRPEVPVVPLQVSLHLSLDEDLDREPEHNEDPLKKDIESVNYTPLDPLEWSLSVLYPGTRLIANYTQGNRTVPWYLPEQKLAIGWQTADSTEETGSRRFWEQKGISLIRLTQLDIGNHRAIERQIRRQVR